MDEAEAAGEDIRGAAGDQVLEQDECADHGDVGVALQDAVVLEEDQHDGEDDHGGPGHHVRSVSQSSWRR